MFLNSVLRGFFALLITVVSFSLGAENMDLREAKFPLMAQYKAEAFLSNDIYSESEALAGQGKKLYYTPTDYALLLEYKVDPTTGFNAGLYQLSNGKYIIAYGGTMATERDSTGLLSTVDTIEDFVTNLNLLNSKKISYQPYQATAYVINLGDMPEYQFTESNLTLVGHSLGGGMAMHASYNTDYPAVTFNTAPFPFPYNPLYPIASKDIKITNIMSNLDPLTATLIAVEDSENGGHDPSKPTHGGELLKPIATLLNKWDSNDHLNLYIAGLLSLGTSQPVESLRSWLKFGLTSGHTQSLSEVNFSDFLSAVEALKDERIDDFILHTKSAYDISGQTLNNLMLGERYVLETDTAHSMRDLIYASYLNVNGLGLERIRNSNPEFYSVIDGSYEHDGVPFPNNSNMSENIVSRVAYYFYAEAYAGLLASEKDISYSQTMNAIVHQDKINDIANKYLKVDGLVGQVLITVNDALVGGENIDEKTKQRIVNTMLDSGKGEVMGYFLSEDTQEYVTIFEDCVKGIPWVPSVPGAIGNVIGEFPSKVINCGLSQTAKTTGRFINSYMGLMSLRDYNSYLVAEKYLNRFYTCGGGAYNDACLAEAFGGEVDFDDQLQNIIDTHNAGAGALDWTIRNYAADIIRDYQTKILTNTFNILNYISPEVLRTFNYANRHTNTLDATLRYISYEVSEDTVWLDITLENTSGRDIILNDVTPLLMSNGEETTLAIADGSNQILSGIIKPGEKKQLNRIPIKLNQDYIFDKTARLSLLIEYQSVDGAFQDKIQRIVEIDPNILEPEELPIEEPEPGVDLYFILPTTASLNYYVVNANIGDDIKIIPTKEAPYLLDFIQEALSANQPLVLWYYDLSDGQRKSIPIMVKSYNSGMYLVLGFVAPATQFQPISLMYYRNGDSNYGINFDLPVNWNANRNSDNTNPNTSNFTPNQLIASHLFKKPLSQLNYNYNNWGESPHLYDGTSGHAGIDIQTKDVAGGNPNNNSHPFYAVSSGKVVAAKRNGTYHLISVYNARTNTSTIYLHAKQIDVQVGDVIYIGDRLGIQGDRGITGAWHVHVEVRQGEKLFASLNKTGTLDPIAHLLASLRNTPLDYSDTTTVSSGSTRVIKTYNVYDADNNLIRTVDTFYLSGVYNKNIKIESGTVYVSRYAKIYGDLIQTGGTLKVNNGSLIVKGNYYIASADGSSSGSGQLHMINDSDRVKVSGDFVIDTTGYGRDQQEAHAFFTAGLLEIRGDFTQRYANGYYRKSFYAQGTHKVVLSGNQKQTVSFQSPSKDNSHFNILEIKNTSSAGVEFITAVAVTSLFDHHNNTFDLKNLDQSNFADYDEDGVKDHLDSYPVDPNKSTDDKDGDGVDDKDDAFPDDPNESVDTDSDGVGNNADIDDDGDGIPDTWEIANGLDPLDSTDASNDQDEDGYTNLHEFAAGTDPQDATSIPEEQLISIKCPANALAGSEITCGVWYDTSDNNAEAKGVIVNLHFDSNKLEWLSFGNTFQVDLMSQDTQAVYDTDDLDEISTTDSYLLSKWESINSTWPGQNVAIKLYDVTFRIIETLDIGENTTITFSGEAAIESGYRLTTTPQTITVGPTFTFDIDGDGEVKPLTDGLLTLRYMFGFRGDALVNNAIGSTGIRQSSSEIETFFTDGDIYLDIDGDGTNKPLTDGLLLLRYLFGFRDDALINSAVGIDAKRNNSEAIGAYIESMY